MSTHAEVKRMTVPQLLACKGQRKIVALTAYSVPTARVVDDYVDFILIGDSTAMVAYGLPNTLSISLEQIGHHTAAVVRGTKRACIVADLPFGSYQESLGQAFRSAGYLLSQGADAVKLEGGEIMAETVEYLVSRGIPVLAHVGLMPQYVNTMGGYLAQGKTPDSAARILADALALEKAGAFGVVLEGVAEALGAEITSKLSIPTIGIGASPSCDGQILVTDDMLGLSGNRVPKFVKRYADLDTIMRNAVQQYADEVRGGKFPEAQHCFGVKRT
ncbi:3-methyl-2-oxobutanoate hydroxymethyltransferase [Zwartia panacis]|uniref:3-methyl-2-oxobutanoate hydroxymethyltransferase n=1 Tax=Zwartia panacis TaxID=2683345 RepID=UPI0025B47F68|nr:3-methyl-2-oxobutanoate hydroxymethyltransferase [Zwartia panacis]MDN4017061.1 3-methyl-2-oxobutanoate hydroxymethyltransferase [Zwartia panacis]